MDKWGILMRKPELLAPAKNLECMKKVIEHGADSVYRIFKI